MSESYEKDSDALRARARERIEQGRLPRSKALRIWGGEGSGLRCDLCDAPITSGETEFELQLDLAPSGETIRFHRHCHILWTEARDAFDPREWRPVSRELPPSGVVVEARVSLGGRRSIVLSVIYLSSPQPKAENPLDEERSASAAEWLNATTRGPLPEGWLPVEWRPMPDASSPRAERPSNPNAGAAA